MSLKLLLITLNTVEPTFTCILHGLKFVVHISPSLSVGQLSRSSMALLLDVNPYLQCQKLGIKVSVSPVRHPLCLKLATIHSVLSADNLSSVTSC